MLRNQRNSGKTSLQRNNYESWPKTSGNGGMAGKCKQY